MNCLAYKYCLPQSYTLSLMSWHLLYDLFSKIKAKMKIFISSGVSSICIGAFSAVMLLTFIAYNLNCYPFDVLAIITPGK